MVISIKEILERNIITGRDYGDGDGLVEPEGTAIDVRLGEILEMDKDSEAFLGKTTRQTKVYNSVAKYHLNTSDWFTLQPNTYYQFKSIEKINVPADLVMRFCARFNLLSNGIMIVAYKADPGFSGEFVVPIINLSGVPFKIELGARWGQCEFHQIKGESVLYRGQWKNGRTHTPKEEVQV